MPSRSSIVIGGTTLDANLQDNGKVRETDQIGGNADGEIMDVRNSAPGDTDYGAVVRPIPSKEVAGVGIGAAADAEATGSGSVIAILKRLRTLLGGGLPSALSSGRLAVDGSGVTLTVAGSVGVASLPTVGQTTMANAISVAIASNQSAVPVSAASLPLPSGAATLAEQQTQTTSLQLVDDVVHAVNGAISKVAAIGAQLDDTGTTAATENAVAPLRITSDRALHVQLRSGAADYGTSGAPLRVDPTGDTTQPVSIAGTVAVQARVDLTAAAPTSIPVGTSEASAVASNATRKGLYLKNVSTSGQRISIAFDGAAAVLDSGYTLETGDVFLMGPEDFTTGEVRAISSAASGLLAGQEFST